jgi:uncharacterized protein (TIGR03437 family)
MDAGVCEDEVSMGHIGRSFAFGIFVSVALAQGPGTVTGVGNAAGSGSSAVAPGSLATIFGTALASSLSSANTVPLSTSLGDVQGVTFNGISAPVAFISGTQIRVQVPWEVTPGTAQVVVMRGGNASAPVNAQVNAMAPGIFTLNFGTPQALAVNADNTLVAAASSIPGVTSHGANPGDTITIYANGLGPVDAAPSTGAAAGSTTRNTTNPVTVSIGGVDAQTTFAGLAPQYVGVYQINVVVAQGTPTGPTVPVQVRVGDVTGADPATLAIGN